jgi:YHS domain-containing protein
MEVKPETATDSAEFEGETYYFWSSGCKDAFLEEPRRYLGGADRRAAARVSWANSSAARSALVHPSSVTRSGEEPGSPDGGGTGAQRG